MKLTDINKTGSWRARLELADCAEELRMNGNLMVAANDKKDWKEYQALYFESKTALEKLSEIFDVTD